MTRVLVTGGSGFVGRHLVPALRDRGHEVLAPPRSELDLLAGDPSRWLGEHRPEVLVHLAWHAEHGRFWTAPENLDWVAATMGLLRAFVVAGGRRAVLAGTCAEYDWSAARQPLSEDTAPLAPASLYGAAKDAVRRVAEPFAAQEGVELAWARIFFPFGPGEPDGRLIPSVARALLDGCEAPTTGGEQVRDFVYVADVASALATLAAAPVIGAVNVGTGEGLAVRDVVESVAREVGRTDLLRVGALPDRDGEPPRIVADARRLRATGWIPQVPIDEAVARSVAALRA